MSAEGSSGGAGAAGAGADAADPIEAHVAELAAVLHGAEREKARMLSELREGLLDAAAELAPGCQPDHEAAREAVRQFGGVAELAPGFQRELTIVQARHTSRRILLLAPLLLPCWYLLAAAGPTAHRLPYAAQVLLAHLGGTAAATALAAAAFLAATGRLARRLSTPDRLPVMVAWTGTTAAVALALSAFTLTIASLLTSSWPLCALAGAVAIVFHAKIAASARACRQCARPAVAA
ncbi:permease prefix domain 1-containing protein [Streptomyces erythrochromogenes]|uniref:Permease prefix domain 1-containing protein n=1 Tax=Streptomyces erythrochromogenes TaxID=285574 RepID=A0ABZ1QKX6_9ACTN|nr:permease prefix domain 1-containing protein [Streptomyces erythrochromogenes]MCX5589272.1 permease prefix domain 1-containing protein [Streptomyces erythrochromogenes]